MKTNPETEPSSPAPEPPVAQTPELNPEPEVLEFAFSNRHTGKVARLPKAVRDRLNLMLS